MVTQGGGLEEDAQERCHARARNQDRHLAGDSRPWGAVDAEDRLGGAQGGGQEAG